MSIIFFTIVKILLTGGGNPGETSRESEAED